MIRVFEDRVPKELKQEPEALKRRLELACR